MKEGLSFARDLSLENSADSYLCFRWLYLTQCLTSFSSIDHFLPRYTQFFILFFSNINEVSSINPSANVFVFGDFNAHHETWLTYSGGSDRPGKLCYNFSISNNLTQIVKLSYSDP